MWTKWIWTSKTLAVTVRYSTYYSMPSGSGLRVRWLPLAVNRNYTPRVGAEADGPKVVEELEDYRLYYVIGELPSSVKGGQARQQEQTFRTFPDKENRFSAANISFVSPSFVAKTRGPVKDIYRYWNV
jgi:hypothetical protein